MDAQLRLLTAPEPITPASGPSAASDDTAPPLDASAGSWRLSDRTRSLGRQGIRQARAALQRTPRPSSTDGDAGVATHSSAA